MWTKIVAGRAYARRDHHRWRDYRPIWNAIAIRATMKTTAAASSHKNHIDLPDRPETETGAACLAYGSIMVSRCGEKTQCSRTEVGGNHYHKTGQKCLPTPRRHSVTLSNGQPSLKRERGVKVAQLLLGTLGTHRPRCCTPSISGDLPSLVDTAGGLCPSSKSRHTRSAAPRVDKRVE